MLKKFHFLVLLALGPLAGFGQQPDTVLGKQFRELTVRAAQPALFAPGSRVTQFDSAALSQQAGGSVADLLQARTPIFVKTYGHNMLATVSFRGTSASHTAVLWNGLAITQPTLGLTDLSLLPANAVQDVQLLHGSASSNFGSGAIGGAILLNNSSVNKPGLGLSAQQDLGSFGRSFSQAKLSFGSEKIAFDASGYLLQAQNDFPFVNTTQFGSPKERQVNAAQHQKGLTANLTYRPSRQDVISVRNWFTFSNTQSQPTMAAVNTQARNLNKNLRVMSDWTHASKFGATNVKAAFFNDQMQYRDEGNASDSEVQTYQIQAEHGLQFKEKFNLNVGAEMQHFAAQVSDYGRNVTENRASIFSLLKYTVSNKLILNLNWRQAFIQRFNPPASPSAGFDLNILTLENAALHWKGTVSRGYRVPTLNDRFWPPGNPNLKPEASWNYESGLVYKYAVGNFGFETEATVFSMAVDNWIQWIPPKTGGLWAPVNLKKVNSRGLEYSAKIHNKTGNLNISAGGNYAFTLSEQSKVYYQSSELKGKQLIYVPLHTATAFTDGQFKNWQLSVTWQFTGERFTNPENSRALEAYQLLSVYGGRTFRWQQCRFQVLGSVQNLTNTIYQTYEYYAMPGRYYNLSVRFHLN